MENVIIDAYLAPHPLDEDGCFEEDWISWLPGYVNEEGEDGLPSFYHDSNIELYRKIEALSTDLFKTAMDRMSPLLHDYHFKKIYLPIDCINYRCSSKSLAGYNYKLSNPAKGKYYFSVDFNLLAQYAAYLNQNIEKLPNIGIWEHEIVHLIDHWEIVKASSLAFSNLPVNNLQYYLLKYREEGIANLFDLMDGKLPEIKSRKQAYELFHTNYEMMSQKLLKLDKTNDQIRREVYSNYDFYTAGPWIILDMLGEIPMVTDIIEIETLENKISNNEIIDDQLKLEIMKNAFYIDNEWFNSKLSQKI